jgi:DNA repair protein RecO (recombination protein O)
MIVKTPAIVLSSIKYAEADLIARLYTRELGTVSYILKGIRKSKKGKLKPAMFQPMTQLLIESRHKAKGQLEYIKECSVQNPFEGIHVDIVKSSIILFFSEVLTQLLTEQQQDSDLYDYLSSSFLYLDKADSVSNFPIKVLIDLSVHMGFSPDLDTIDQPFFNLVDGHFDNDGLQPHHTSEREATLIKQFIGTDFDYVKEIKMNRSERSELLGIIIDYFQIHMQVFKKPSSLSYLKQIFD